MKLRRTVRAVAMSAVVATLAVAARSAAAQQITVGGALKPGQPFSGQGATPLTGTTVMHFALAPDSARGGARLAYALLVRGAPRWYQQRTAWGSDSGAVAPGVDATWWEVGPVHYTVEYDAAAHRLRAFGHEFDLTRSRVVLVTLGATDANGAVGARAVAGPAVELFVPEPQGFAAQVLAADPIVRAFAADGPVR